MRNRKRYLQYIANQKKWRSYGHWFSMVCPYCAKRPQTPTEALFLESDIDTWEKERRIQNYQHKMMAKCVICGKERYIPKQRTDIWGNRLVKKCQGRYVLGRNYLEGNVKIGGTIVCQRKL